jgi:hypothetical protein
VPTARKKLLDIMRTISQQGPYQQGIFNVPELDFLQDSNHKDIEFGIPEAHQNA